MRTTGTLCATTRVRAWRARSEGGAAMTRENGGAPFLGAPNTRIALRDQAHVEEAEQAAHDEVRHALRMAGAVVRIGRLVRQLAGGKDQSGHEESVSRWSGLRA